MEEKEEEEKRRGDIIVTRLCIIHLTQEVITHVLTMEAFENRTTMESSK